ncbi:type 1 glutamine amidotransferase [Marinobacter salinisoli]|uniref:Type 1 glutamine amidotransferase n=1 Tax=Marinobacter salinisoli TaxID=2769486 RepID=A0ABX7MRA5_9GAMM|nr:type 1 glutamine amidotransferase [Marinobacter salinisoli]QSP93929.1 type 1 glutamine amidotransferase [Marinobacter salinisoli]
MTLKIGILATGITPDPLIGEFGSFADMFQRLFKQAGQTFDYVNYDVRDGEFPESATACDGWIVTGSKSNVYENLPWMQRLKVLIRDIYQADRPMLGICFGHQIIADAFDAHVHKYSGGWGVGLHEYTLTREIEGLDLSASTFTLSVMHQDQVLEKPAAAEVLAESAFCPYAVLQYDNRILTFQAHPEFDVTFETRLVKHLRGQSVPEADADQALEGLSKPDAATDSMAIARWMAGFLRRDKAETSTTKPRQEVASAC